MKYRKTGIILCVLAALMLMSGCTTDYKKEDIEKYVRDNFGNRKYSVSDQYREVKGEDGYTDRLWVIKEEESGMIFHVLDDYHWGMESLANFLTDDYSDSVLMMYEEELSLNRLVKTGQIVIDSSVDEEEMNSFVMKGYFRNKEELIDLIAQLEDCNAFLKQQGYKDTVSSNVEILYPGPLDHPCYKKLVGARTRVRTNTDKQYIYDSALKMYAMTGLDYRLIEVLNDLNEEEISAVILAENTDRVGVERENGEIEYYDDLIGNAYSYGLSISTLYQVLLREGFKVNGNEMHFMCKGADGIEYEFAYEFASTKFDGDECSYYLSDGEPVKLGYAYNSHISAYSASELFGIVIHTDWNKTIKENSTK